MAFIFLSAHFAFDLFVFTEAIVGNLEATLGDPSFTEVLGGGDPAAIAEYT